MAQRQLYVAARSAEVAALNEDLAAHNDWLGRLLAGTLDVDDYLDLESLKQEPEIPPFQPGELATAEPAPELATFMPPPLSGIAKLVPGAGKKHERAVANARERYDADNAAHAERERQRIQALEAAEREHHEKVANITARAEAQNREIDKFRAQFDAGDPEAVVQYFSLVLDRSHYPEGFPRTHRIAFVP